MEALAEHLAWIPMAQSLDTSRKTALADKSRRLLATVLDAMEVLRQVNDGRLSFMLSTSGTPYRSKTMDGAQHLAELMVKPTSAIFSMPRGCTQRGAL